MLVLSTVRRFCAASDVVFLTIIASSFSKVRAKSELAAIPEGFPTIASCAAAVGKDSRRALTTTPLCGPRDEEEEEERDAVNEPALIRLKEERDPEKLFSLFQSNSHNRLVVENRFAFEDTVSRLAGARRTDLVEQILEHQKALPQGRREGFVVRVIMLYGRAGMPNHALKTFNEMHLFGCPRTTKSFNAVLQVLLQARRFEEIKMVFYQVSSKYQIEMDVISYNTIIKAFCEMDSLNMAYLFVVEMEKAGINPDVITYTTLMSASYKCNHFKIGEGLWNLMVLSGCLPNLATFNVRIQSLINRRRGWQANHLANKMVRCGIKPDELTYNLIIKGFYLMGETEMAKRIFYAMPSRGCQPNSKIYQTMVHYLCKAGMFDLAFGLCRNSMKNNWYPSVETLLSLLKGLASNSNESKAWNIMKFVRQRVPPYSCEELKGFEAVVKHTGKMNHRQI